MIGLLFFVVITIWAAVAFALGSKIPLWLGLKQYRVALGSAFALLLFVAPVADEIIAWPQMQALCKKVRLYELAPGMDEKKAFGRTVHYAERTEKFNLWPPTVELLRWDIAFVDAVTKEPVLVATRFEPLRGMLGIPNGSSGGQMTVVLGKRDCGSTVEAYDSKGIPSRFGYLNLASVATP